MVAELDSGAQSRYDAGSRLAGRQRRRAGYPRAPVLLRFVSTGRTTTGTTAPTSTATCRSTRAPATKGFGKLTLHPDQLDAASTRSYRDSKRVDRSDLFAANAADTTGTGSETRQKIGTVEGSWVVGPTQPSPPPSTRISPTRRSGVRTTSPTSAINTAAGTRLDLAHLDTARPADGAAAGRRADRFQRLHPAAHRPATGIVSNGARVGGGTVGYGSQFNDQTSSATALRSGYNLTLGTRVRHELHVGYQRLRRFGRSGAQLERLGSNLHSGRTARADRRNRAVGVLHRTRSSSRRPAPPRPSAPKYQLAELRSERRDAVAHLDVQRRAAGEQRHALRAGAAQGLVDALRLRRRPRQQVQDVRHPVQQDAPAAARRDLGLQRQRHRLRQLRDLQPGRELAAARRLVGPQSGRHVHRRALRRQRRPVRHRCRSAPRPASCSSTT